MSRNGQNTADKDPLITSARKAKVVGIEKFANALSPNLQRSGGHGVVGQSSSGLLKTVGSQGGHAFSAFQGPPPKRNEGNEIVNADENLRTPVKPGWPRPLNVDMQNHFQGINVVESPGHDTSQSPMCDFYKNIVINALQSPSSPIPTVNYKGSSLDMEPPQESSLDWSRRPMPAVHPAATLQREQVSNSNAHGDLDIMDSVKEFHASMFQGSLANNRDFSVRRSSHSHCDTQYGTAVETPLGPSVAAGSGLGGAGVLSKLSFDVNVVSSLDSVSSSSKSNHHFENLSIDEKPLQAANSFQRDSDFIDRSISNMNVGGASHQSVASRSFPEFSHQAAHLFELTDTSVFSHYDQQGSSRDNNNTYNHSVANNFNNSDASRSILHSSDSELLHSEYPVKHSYPPYHRYGNNNPMPPYQQPSESQLHPYSQPFYPPKRQNWIADHDDFASTPQQPHPHDQQQQHYQNQPTHYQQQQHNSSFSQADEVARQWSDRFLEARGHQNTSKGYAHNTNSGGVAAPKLSSSYDSANVPLNHRYAGQQLRSPSETHANSVLYSSAPAFLPRYDASAGPEAIADTTHAATLLASPWSTASSFSPPDAGSHSSKAQFGRMQTSESGAEPPSLAGPRQHPNYEPRLPPTTTNVRVGKHRNGRQADGRGISSASNSVEQLRLSGNTTTASSTGTGTDSNAAADWRNSGGSLKNSSILVDANLGIPSDKASAPPPLPLKSTKEVFKNTFLKPDLVESPRSKAAYKEFFKDFRQKEKLSYESAKVHALTALDKAPENAKWRIYLEMADLSKRHNQLEEARFYFQKVCEIQPLAHMGWYEWSKLEEECGELHQALRILKGGLAACTINETLLTKVIKLHERLHCFEEVREMLGKLKREPTEKVWKSMLEGSLFEARTGNMAISRKIFKFLISHVPWYGPIYFEAFRLEEKEDDAEAAFGIIERGLKELPRYGPLWFGLFRIMERKDIALEHLYWLGGGKPILKNLTTRAAKAVRFISKELTWKVHFEVSQAQERAAEIAALGVHQHTGRPLQECREEMLGDARRSLVRSLLSCPPNLRWRVLLVGARLELGVGAIDKARLLLQRATVEVPVKSKSFVYLECSRVEEFIGNLDAARQLLRWAKQEVTREWKVYLEAVLVEARAGLIEKAAMVAREAVKVHSGTGRLWAIYIQLCHRLETKYFYETEQTLIQQRLNQLLGHPAPTTSAATATVTSDKAAGQSPLKARKETPHPNHWLSKDRVIRRAIAEVPKSGEVWCERARCQLNPLSVHCFDLNQAQRSLGFAIQFTPQYGDTFVEYVRVEMLSQVLLPRVLTVLGLPVIPFLDKHLNEDVESDTLEILLNDRLRAQLKEAESQHKKALAAEEVGWRKLAGKNGAQADADEWSWRAANIVALEKMSYSFGNLATEYSEILIKNLNRRCVNADPNYGSAWFHCREQPYDIPSSVLLNALHKLVHELVDTQALYARGLLHFIRRALLQSSWSAASDNGELRLAKNRSFVQDDCSPACSPARSSSAPPGRQREAKAGAGSGSDNGSSSRGKGGGGGVGGTGSRQKPPPLDLTKSLDGKLKARAQDKTAVSYGLTMMGGRRDDHHTLPPAPLSHRSEEASEEEVVQRDSELLSDFQKAGERLGASWPSFDEVELLPFVDTGKGALYCCTDFITGLVEMNRMMFNPNLSEETRRKNLFGSDQIVS